MIEVFNLRCSKLSRECELWETSEEVLSHNHW